MGKPIAGQNQFPFNIKGFLVDGAKINGKTYPKMLYIHKQRSINQYDLMDTSGNIFRKIKLVHTDSNGKRLQFFSTDEILVDVIEDNSFFMKIQDPARNIFAFVKLWQWHKCVTDDGNYIYRTSDIDSKLSGVFINPSVSTVKVGSELSYESLFFPKSHANKDGTWYVNMMNEDKIGSGSVELVSSDKNKARAKGVSPGKALLSFVPFSNDSLITHSVINIVDSPDIDVELFEVHPVDTFPMYEWGSTFEMKVVTFPYDAVLTEPLNVKISESYHGSTIASLISVSEDFKTYKFQTYKPTHYYDMDSSIELEFIMSNPTEYSYYSSEVGCVEDVERFIPTYNFIHYGFPYSLRPNMSKKVKCYRNMETLSFEYDEIPLESTDPSIATYDHTTQTIQTYNKTGKVNFIAKWVDNEGYLNAEKVSYRDIEITNECYDFIDVLPAKVDKIHPGESMKFTVTGFIGDETHELPAYVVNNNNFSVDKEGNLKVSISANTEPSYHAYVFPEISTDLYTLSEYGSGGSSRVYTVKPGTEPEPITELYSSLGENGVKFHRFTEDVKYSGNNQMNEIIHVTPGLTYTNKGIEIVSISDESMIEIVEKERLLDNYQYTLGALYMNYNILKRGQCTITFRAIHYPEVTHTINIISF